MELKIIEQRNVLDKEFKIYGSFEEPLFLAKDVAEWIEHTNSRMMLENIDVNEKVLRNVYTLGGSQESWFVTEDGLYEILMQSRKPIAKQFKKEVKEILKSIRKNGMYAVDELLDNPDLAIKTFMKLKEEREKNKLLQNEIENLTLDNEVKEQQLLELQPKATYYDLILQCKDLYSISSIAEDYGKTAQWLNTFLVDKKVQYKHSKNNPYLLYREYKALGYTSTKTINYSDSRGEQHGRIHTYWTQKGRLFIYELLKQEGILPTIERENEKKRG